MRTLRLLDMQDMNSAFDEYSPKRVRLLGGDIDLVTPRDVLDFVRGCTVQRRTAVIANHNSHSLYLCRKSPELRAFFERADLIEADSTPLIAWGRLLGLPIRNKHRSTYLDWRDDFWRLADANGWRVFYLGGAPGVAEAACQRLGEEFPNARLASHNGYFDDSADSAENESVIGKIAAFDPHIVFVGMGMPRQEQWILRNLPRLGGSVVFSVGAAYDYEAGVQTAAPRWMGPLGLEWLFRLATQPRRLASRYLFEPWFLLPAALEDVMHRAPSRKPKLATLNRQGV